MDPRVRDHFHAAERNLTIATDLSHHQPEGLTAPAFEWVVIVCFYATVRGINAFILDQTGELPISHGERYRFIRHSSALEPVVYEYADLRDWSEQARYTRLHDRFGEHQAQIAIEIARNIHSHIERQLASGYS